MKILSVITKQPDYKYKKSEDKRKWVLDFYALDKDAYKKLEKKLQPLLGSMIKWLMGAKLKTSDFSKIEKDLTNIGKLIDQTKLPKVLYRGVLEGKGISGKTYSTSVITSWSVTEQGCERAIAALAAFSGVYGKYTVVRASIPESSVVISHSQMSRALNVAAALRIDARIDTLLDVVNNEKEVVVKPGKYAVEIIRYIERKNPQAGM